MSKNPRPIPPGFYTKDTLPPISAEGQKILDEIKTEANAWEKSPEGKRTRARAEHHYKKSGMGDFIGIMLGATGYGEDTFPLPPEDGKEEKK